jgi:hypothetical protein
MDLKKHFEGPIFSEDQQMPWTAPVDRVEQSEKGPNRGPLSALDNLCRLWNRRRSLSFNRSRQMNEFMLEVLAERTSSNVWQAALKEAQRRVTLFYPPDK